MVTSEPNYEASFDAFNAAIGSCAMCPSNEIAYKVNKLLTPTLRKKYREANKEAPDVTTAWMSFFRDCKTLLKASIPTAATHDTLQARSFVQRLRRGWTPKENLRPEISLAAYYCAHVIDDLSLDICAASIDNKVLGGRFEQVFGIGVPKNTDQGRILTASVRGLSQRKPVKDNSSDEVKYEAGQVDSEVNQIPISEQLDEEEITELVDIGDKNHVPQLLFLDGEGWTQNSIDGRDYELQAELFCGQVSRKLDGRRIRYGLREVHIRVSGESFASIRRYHGGEGDLPSYVHLHHNKVWKIHSSNGPTDNFGMLDGRVIAGPLCVAERADGNLSKLSLEVYIPRTTPKLSVLAENSDDDEKIGDKERQNLIEKMYLIYLHKLNRVNDENILLSSCALSV
ncbi:MAG: hypothetical protein AAFQ58_23510 [Pseudomonadota bacterium]